MAIKVLFVIDGIYRFDEPANTEDFTFITLADTFVSAGFQLTRAHRDPAGDGDISGFNFATSVNLLDYDVVWMIGYDGRNQFPGSTVASGANKLQAAELAALASFMDAGGGVFATGDHDSIGADMCGHIPRVRVMRAWFGEGDGASPMPADFTRNFPVVSAGRADTVQKNPLGDYDLNNDGSDENHVYFENQSDSIAQPITPVSTPAHPILRRNGMDITVYPDHMHEGQTLGDDSLLESHYTHTLPAGLAPGFVEFPALDGVRETPKVIATGQVLEHSQLYAYSGGVLDAEVATAKTVNTLCAYDGRKVGVGRVVTGATFHHYIDINLTGSSDIVSAEQKARAGADAAKGEGFNYAGASETFADIKAVFVNIVNWLARPRPSISLILERSTFSQDEVNATAVFEGAILVTVDGLKPEQFPGGPIDDLSPSTADLQSWAPAVAVAANGIAVEVTGVDSDLPALPDVIQRFTFTYRVRFLSQDGFNFAGEVGNFSVTATLESVAVAEPLVDSAWLQLVKSANPFMLDLADGNSTTWLSSDVRVFPLVAGESKFGQSLPDNATKAQAYTFIRALMASISVSQFESLSVQQAESALSPFPTTTESGKKIYNFAIARVRLNGVAVPANNVRVFFRIFTSQTTAALTYRHPEGGVPLEGYKQTAGANPIAIPGVTSGGDEWLSFPFFSQARAASPDAQTDTDNVQNISPMPGSEVSTFFGALIDNNLDEAYLPPTPLSAAAAISLSEQLLGEHQCLVAQIEFAGTPIPDGARPSTSDKLSQRNLAISSVANPGLDASRMALHTFEIESTPRPVTADLLPDELLLEWLGPVPQETLVRVHIPDWDAAAVVALADGLYARHDIRAEDAHTISLPGGGTRYVPVPRSLYRQTGVIMVSLPLGIKKGQRFDLAVRQITTRSRAARVKTPAPEFITAKEAQKLIGSLGARAGAAGVDVATHARQPAQRGVYDLGNNKTLVTNLALLDMAGEGAVIVQSADPEQVAAARRQSGRWRETVGSFQLGIPVSVKSDMFLYYMRLLSVLRWRAERLHRRSRWQKTFTYYVERMAEKYQGLGGNPFTVAATPDGNLDVLLKGNVDCGDTESCSDVCGYSDIPEPCHDENTGPTCWEDIDTGPAHRQPSMPADGATRTVTGKISGLLYDHFGDFEGLVLETFTGAQVRFFSREKAVLTLVREAWLQRYPVTVVSVTGHPQRIRRVILQV